MEPENGGPLEVRRFLLETIISSFQPLIFGGCNVYYISTVYEFGGMQPSEGKKREDIYSP